MGFVKDADASERTKRANNYARRFNAVAEAHGFDLPMEVLIPLIELFGEALADDAVARGPRVSTI